MTPVDALTGAQTRNAAAAQLTNPVPSTQESVAAGRQLYARLCVRCHGPSGKGDGGGAGAGGQPADFTDATWEFGASDGEIYTSIKDGTSADMDAYGERLKDTEMWQLVNFLKSLGPGAKK
jgi:mono/diheme cytochrome c family protein